MDGEATTEMAIERNDNSKLTLMSNDIEGLTEVVVLDLCITRDANVRAG